MPPLVSIIIVNWNAKNYLKNCIESLQNQSYKNLEIILVDNASSDDSVEFIEKNFSNVHVIKNSENLGFAEGNNIGIKKSKGEIIGLFNPDAIADKDWLSTLVSVLQSPSNIGAVTGKMYYLGDEFGKDAVFCSWSKIDPYTAMPYNFTGNEPTAKVDYLSGAAMLVKREVIERVGYLDHDYFLYFEDTDWCARMIRSGYDLTYVPNAKVWHKVSSSISNSDKKIYFMERSWLRFAIKNFDYDFLFLFYIWFWLESLFVFLRDVKRRDFSRSRIRLKVISWNITHLRETLQRRTKDFSPLKKGIFKSYNKSLPLRTIKIPKHSFWLDKRF